MDNFCEIIKEKCKFLCDDIISIFIFYYFFPVSFKESVICLLVVQALFPTYEDNFINTKNAFKKKGIFLLLSTVETIAAVLIPYYLLDISILSICSLYLIVTIILGLSELVDVLLQKGE